MLACAFMHITSWDVVFVSCAAFVNTGADQKPRQKRDDDEEEEEEKEKKSDLQNLHNTSLLGHAQLIFSRVGNKSQSSTSPGGNSRVIWM